MTKGKICAQTAHAVLAVYKDLNGDGLIDDDDKTILGNPYPDLIWSITNDFKIGNVDFSFLFQGSHGAEVRNMGDQYLFNHFNSAMDFNKSTTPNQGFIKERKFLPTTLFKTLHI